MLRATISLNNNASDGRERGDVLEVRLAGTPISRRSERLFLFVDDWRDDDLEAELQARRDAGEPHPVATYPYRAVEPLVIDGVEIGAEMRSRSLVRVTIEALADAADILDPDKPLPPRRRNAVTVVNKSLPARSTNVRAVWDGVTRRREQLADERGRA